MLQVYQEHKEKILGKQWAFSILLFLYGRENVTYRQIKKSVQISDTSLCRRLNELVKYKYLEKFVYGSISKPHYTEYKITDFAIKYINSLLECKTY